MCQHIRSMMLGRISSFPLPVRLGAPCLLILAGCSAPSGTQVEAAAPDNPPGAALPLSLGGRAEAGGDDPFTVAVNCAAALSLTAERLAQMANDPASQEIALLGRAQRHFQSRAENARESSEAGTGSVAAAVGRRREEKAQETTQQAQLAIACLRRFGDDVSASTGAEIGL